MKPTMRRVGDVLSAGVYLAMLYLAPPPARPDLADIVTMAKIETARAMNVMSAQLHAERARHYADQAQLHAERARRAARLGTWSALLAATAGAILGYLAGMWLT